MTDVNQSVPITLDDTSSVVLFREHQAVGGKIVAQATLNNEATLNSLSLEMIDLLRPALDQWQDRDEVVAILITGAGERAFSAGGDIQALYHAIMKNHAAGSEVDSYPFDFFEREYRLDYRLHEYPKPIVALGHGIVMGGGLGVFGGSRFKVVTEKSRIALPEVSIGLFPDAGATRMLGNICRAGGTHWATFMAMTGSHINAADALELGFANQSVAVAAKDQVLAGLLELAWSADTAEHDRQIEALLQALPAAELPALQVDAIDESLNAAGTTAEAVAAVNACAGASEWIDKGIATMTAGCPTSVGVVVEQLKRVTALELADSFRLEMTIATHCARNKDFAEGVRALLVDKDGAPRWQHAGIEDLPEHHVQSHFVEPWPQNPLADLGV